jgi:predicted RNA-binding Zn ribbon-like protein
MSTCQIRRRWLYWEREAMAEEFQLVAGHLALDFANTLDYRYDADRVTDLLPTYERFLEFCRQSRVITAPQLRSLLASASESDARGTLNQVIEFREALYFLILSAVSGRHPADSYLRILNSFLAAARVPDRIGWQRSGFVRDYGGLVSSPAGPLWLILDASAGLLTSPEIHHVRECSEKTCRWLFLDRSRNHSRRWCDMQLCGNRSKAQRFYARRRAGA